MDKICWTMLSKNPEAIHLIEQNLDKVNWSSLSGNPNAIHLIEKNTDKISWPLLSGNPAIFTLNRILIKQRSETFKEELMQQCFHPIRLQYYLDNYNYDIGEECYSVF